MTQWAKFKFFWDTMLGSEGSTLTATSTESAGDHDVDYLYNMLEVNIWKASSSSSQTIIYDAGVGNTATADYLAIIGHNLFTADAVIYLQYSDTGAFAGEETTVVSAYSPTSDNVVLREFATSGAHRYWKLSLTSLTVIPYMAICIWGQKTELDWASASFDPYEQKAIAKRGVSYGGYVTGVHTQYVERSMSLRFADADPALYGKVQNWWESHGGQNLFVAWDTTNSPDDVFLMRPSDKFRNPFNQTGLYRDISISLTGRKE